MASAEDRYVFHVEWHDQQADLLRRYMFTFYPRDNSVEMWDTKNHRPFVRRSEYAEVSLSDLYIGATITVLSRQLKIVEYADHHTRKTLENMKAKTLAMIKPDAYNDIGRIISVINQTGLVIARLRMVRMDQDSAAAFTGMQSQDEGNGAEHTQLLLSDVVVVMELIGKSAVETWKSVMGPFSPNAAKSSAPRSIRAQLGSDDVRNAVHGSSDNQRAVMEVDFFFGEGKVWPTTALFNNCTLCLVRPHAIKSAGDIISQILQAGFEISAMSLWYLDKASAEEFLEVYKGVVPEYHDMVSQCCAGACLVMEVRQQDAVNAFRKLIGPHDPEVAKHLRPNTIRAQYGLDRTRNAVHCTDLPEDGLLEVEYFFNILHGRK
jgi:nucleoside-diphosphate kinase